MLWIAKSSLPWRASIWAVSDHQLGASLRAGFGDAAGDGFLVRDAGDETDLALEIDDRGHGGVLKLRLVLLRCNGREHSAHCTTEM
jgi:hypothetical protein